MFIQILVFPFNILFCHWLKPLKNTLIHNNNLFFSHSSAFICKLIYFSVSTPCLCSLASHARLIKPALYFYRNSFSWNVSVSPLIHSQSFPPVKNVLNQLKRWRAVTHTGTFRSHMVGKLQITPWNYNIYTAKLIAGILRRSYCTASFVTFPFHLSYVLILRLVLFLPNGVQWQSLLNLLVLPPRNQSGKK